MNSRREPSDDLVMAVLVGASLIGFVLGITFLIEPGYPDRYTELYFSTHKVSMKAYDGSLNFNDRPLENEDVKQKTYDISK